jgi:hypothetical protein
MPRSIFMATSFHNRRDPSGPRMEIFCDHHVLRQFHAPVRTSASNNYEAQTIARASAGLNRDFVVVPLSDVFGFRQRILKRCYSRPVQARFTLAKNFTTPIPNIL